MSAALICPQLEVLPQRVKDGRRNHNHVAAHLNQSDAMVVPKPLEGEERAPDIIQFNLQSFSDTETDAFVAVSGDAGVRNTGIRAQQRQRTRLLELAIHR